MNNTEHLDEWEHHPWGDVIRECDRLLNIVIPGYTILQIKQKFGGLRYYIHLPEGVAYGSDEDHIAELIIRHAEREVDAL